MNKIVDVKHIEQEINVDDILEVNFSNGKTLKIMVPKDFEEDTITGLNLVFSGHYY